MALTGAGLSDALFPTFTLRGCMNHLHAEQTSLPVGAPDVEPVATVFFRTWMERNGGRRAVLGPRESAPHAPAWEALEKAETRALRHARSVLRLPRREAIGVVVALAEALKAWIRTDGSDRAALGELLHRAERESRV